MRLGLVIRDVEYRNALIEMLSEFDKDIFIEIAGESGTCRNCVILTDVRPEEIGRDSLIRLSNRTVFITCVKKEACSQKPDDPGQVTIHRVFKYSKLSSIMAEISLVYCKWTGDTGSGVLTRSIAACAESDFYCSDRCMSLARQIIYRRGGSVLILPLGYINDYGSDISDDSNSFARLMYMIDSGRDFPPDAFTASDSYGISYLMLPRGMNPVAYLDEENLRMLVSCISGKFDTVIYDIGTCYRMENIRIMRSADNTVCFETGHRSVDIVSMLGSEHHSEVKEFRVTGDADEALRIDDYVREMYGIEDDGEDKPGGDSKKIR